MHVIEILVYPGWAPQNWPMYLYCPLVVTCNSNTMGSNVKCPCFPSLWLWVWAAPISWVWYLGRPKTVQLQKHEQIQDLSSIGQTRAKLTFNCSDSKLSSRGLKGKGWDIWHPSVEQGYCQPFRTNMWSYSAAQLAHSHCLTAFCVILTPGCPNDVIEPQLFRRSSLRSRHF